MNPPSFYLQLVNPEHPVLWRPSENQLCAFHPGFPHILLEACAARSLAALLEELDAFGEIVPVSGYRPHAMQQETWDGIFGRFRRMAPEYGWILRYPAGKEAITRISSEPWHFRYVGTPHARILSEQGLVLEEYLAGDPGLPLWNGPRPAAGRRP